jgi:hypothetical protein
VAPDDAQIPSFGDAYYQFIEASAILETVTVLPKPFSNALEDDNGNINQADRKMWVHTVGQSALGET